MTATMERPVAYRADNNNIPSSIDTLSSMLDGAPEQLDTSSELTEQADEDSRELSPTGARILRAATRISTFLEKRALNRAHSEALVEDRTRTITLQEAAEATYAENYAATASREAQEVRFASDWDAANRENERFDARVARQERIDTVKNRLRAGGRSALEAVKTAGLVTVGIGIMAGEATGRRVKSGMETAALGAMYAKDKVIDGAKSVTETAALSAMIARDKVVESAVSVGNKVAEGAQRYNTFIDGVEEGIDSGIDSAVNWTSEKITSIREALVARRDVAHTRRQARRERWAAKRQAAKDSIHEKFERSKSHIDVARGVGSAVVSHLLETKRIATSTGQELSDARKL